MGRKTLRWLSDIRRRHGDKVAVITVAIESEASAVRGVAREIGAPLVWAMGTPELVRSFGDVTAVPTLLVFDTGGHTAAVLYGAPPTMHDDLEAKLAPLLGGGRRSRRR